MDEKMTLEIVEANITFPSDNVVMSEWLAIDKLENTYQIILGINVSNNNALMRINSVDNYETIHDGIVTAVISEANSATNYSQEYETTYIIAEEQEGPYTYAFGICVVVPRDIDDTLDYDNAFIVYQNFGRVCEEV